jgi:uncharacterized protein
VTTYLLDANVLIALTVTEHEHHERASRWASGIERCALCPIVEGALVRLLVRIGESALVAQEVLRSVRAMPGCASWPDSLSYVDADLRHVHGHRQVADAYLASLAAGSPGCTLATLDHRLARDLPELTTLLPAI